MANCSNSNGCSCTRVGALSTLSRACGCSRFPYYTGPCPPAPCTTKCGTCAANACGCSGCGCSNCATALNCSGCGAWRSGMWNRSTCGCGCDDCNTCGRSGCDSCNNCGACDGCDDCDDCGTCGCNSCGCDDGCCLSLSGAGHGFFTAAGPVMLSEGGTVTLETGHADSGFFAASYGSILIRRPGLYYAALTADIPGNNEVDTVMRLELDNQRDALPEIAVVAGSDETTSNYAGHAVFHAKAGSLLRLRSLREMAVHCATSRPVFTLTIFRIG